MIKYICDKCDKEISNDKGNFELSEMRTIEFEGGYSSVFGDGDRYKIHLCQQCMYDILKSANLLEKGYMGNRYDKDALYIAEKEAGVA